jgi:hypothetical protein
MTGPAGRTQRRLRGSPALGFPRLFWFLGYAAGLFVVHLDLACSFGGGCQSRDQAYAGGDPRAYRATTSARPRWRSCCGRLDLGVDLAREHLEGWRLHPDRVCPGGDGAGRLTCSGDGRCESPGSPAYAVVALYGALGVDAQPGLEIPQLDRGRAARPDLGPVPVVGGARLERARGVLFALPCARKADRPPAEDVGLSHAGRPGPGRLRVADVDDLVRCGGLSGPALGGPLAGFDLRPAPQPPGWGAVMVGRRRLVLLCALASWGT